MNRLKIILCFVYCSFGLLGQDTIFTFSEFLSRVKQHHPVVKKASLFPDLINGFNMESRSGFDPKVQAIWDQKDYEDKDYYSIIESELKIPTWFGAEIKGGYDRNNGQFINNMDNLPAEGLWSFGLSIPLGKGLIIDERRAALRQADIFERSSMQEQKLMLNELFFEASIAYYDWLLAHELKTIASDGMQLASVRHRGTIGRFNSGDLPAIDTLESYISLQNRQLDRLEAEQMYIKAVQHLENFLWNDGLIPIELAASTVPKTPSQDRYGLIIDSLYTIKEFIVDQHPELLLTDYTIEGLELEQKLNREELKPDIRVGYNLITAPNDPNLFGNPNINDYKLGATFLYPVFQWKGRGKNKILKTKTEMKKLDRAFKQQQISNKLDIYTLSYNNLKQSVALWESTVQNYQQLLSAEGQKFNLGESSVFLLNSREQKYLESRAKLVSLYNKSFVTAMGFLLTSGEISNFL